MSEAPLSVGGSQASGAEDENRARGIKPLQTSRLPPFVTSGSGMEQPVLDPRSMVRLTIAFQASSGRVAQELFDALRFLEPVTRLQPGCLQCCDWIDADLMLHHIEDWDTEADMRRRIRSEEFRSLLEMVEAAREPRVQFDFVATTRGLDYVAEVRGEFGG